MLLIVIIEHLSHRKEFQPVGLVDVLDEYGNPTGIVASREATHLHGYLHGTVHIFLVDNDNNIYTQEYSKLKKDSPDDWDPAVCAGHIDQGETPMQAAIREAKEELGLDLDPEELKLFLQTRNFRYLENNRKDNEIHFVYLLKKDIDPSTIQPDPQEIQAVKPINASLLAKIIDNANILPYRKDQTRVLLENLLYPEA